VMTATGNLARLQELTKGEVEDPEKDTSLSQGVNVMQYVMKMSNLLRTNWWSSTLMSQSSGKLI